MKIIRILVIVALAVALVGCCNKCRKSRESAARPLKGIVWSLVQFDGKTAGGADKYEIIFTGDDAGKVAGIAECNRFFGSYEVLNANGGLRMSQMGATKMMCINPGIEPEFLDMLSRAHLYQFEGNNLYLFVDGKVKAIFESTDKPVEVAE